MSDAILPPSLRSNGGRKAQPARAPRISKRLNRQEMIARRDSCMAGIAHANNERGAQSEMLHKARQLLTRHWAASSWRARADLVRTAEWLVGIGASPARFGDGSTQEPDAVRNRRLVNSRSDFVSEPTR
jgi:hypothetical protein